MDPVQGLQIPELIAEVLARVDAHDLMRMVHLAQVYYAILVNRGAAVHRITLRTLARFIDFMGKNISDTHCQMHTIALVSPGQLSTSMRDMIVFQDKAASWNNRIPEKWDPPSAKKLPSDSTPPATPVPTRLRPPAMRPFPRDTTAVEAATAYHALSLYNPRPGTPDDHRDTVNRICRGLVESRVLLDTVMWLIALDVFSAPDARPFGNAASNEKWRDIWKIYIAASVRYALPHTFSVCFERVHTLVSPANNPAAATELKLKLAREMRDTIFIRELGSLSDHGMGIDTANDVAIFDAQMKQIIDIWHRTDAAAFSLSFDDFFASVPRDPEIPVHEMLLPGPARIQGRFSTFIDATLCYMAMIGATESIDSLIQWFSAAQGAALMLDPTLHTPGMGTAFDYSLLNTVPLSLHYAIAHSPIRLFEWFSSARIRDLGPIIVRNNLPQLQRDLNHGMVTLSPYLLNTIYRGPNGKETRRYLAHPSTRHDADDSEPIEISQKEANRLARLASVENPNVAHEDLERVYFLADPAVVSSIFRSTWTDVSTRTLDVLDAMLHTVFAIPRYTLVCDGTSDAPEPTWRAYVEFSNPVEETLVSECDEHSDVIGRALLANATSSVRAGVCGMMLQRVLDYDARYSEPHIVDWLRVLEGFMDMTYGHTDAMYDDPDVKETAASIVRVLFTHEQAGRRLDLASSQGIDLLGQFVAQDMPNYLFEMALHWNDGRGDDADSSGHISMQEPEQHPIGFSWVLTMVKRRNVALLRRLRTWNHDAPIELSLTQQREIMREAMKSRIVGDSEVGPSVPLLWELRQWRHAEPTPVNKLDLPNDIGFSPYYHITDRMASQITRDVRSVLDAWEKEYLKRAHARDENNLDNADSDAESSDEDTIDL